MESNFRDYDYYHTQIKTQLCRLQFITIPIGSVWPLLATRPRTRV